MNILDKIVDQHTHSHFSPDSKERMENYLKLTKGDIVITEHLDFKDINNNGEDSLLDYKAYKSEIDNLNRIYSNRIKIGIEIGYTVETESKIIDYMENKSFDLIILSIHQNHKIDYMKKIDKNQNLLEVVNNYYDNLLSALNSNIDFDILGHIDYCLRNEKYNLKDLKKLESKFKRILNKLIKREIALEVNTRSMYQFGGLHFYSYILDLYKSLGGELISLGSDAHYTNNFKINFLEAIQLLKEKGFKEVSIFTNRKITSIEI